MARNGQLSYTADGITQSFNVYIETFTQPLQLSGSTQQTRLSRQFYPRAFSPGNGQIGARATSQDELQRFSKFVRDHHITMINTPSSMAFTRGDSESPGYQRLMRLYVVGEDILWRGWIPNFTINKRGVMEPAPQFNFEFYVVFDEHATDIYASRQITKLWWQQQAQTPVQVSGGKVEKAPTDDPTLDIINIIDPSISQTFGNTTGD
jgi:hypothetical protein